MKAILIMSTLFLTACSYTSPSDYLKMKVAPEPMAGRSVNVHITQDVHNNCGFTMSKDGRPETEIHAEVTGCKRQ